MLLPAVYESIHWNVIEAISKYTQSVEVFTYMQDKHGVNDTHDDLWAALAVLKPIRRVVVKKSNCKELRKVKQLPNSSCWEKKGWLQISWVDECFADSDRNDFSHYIRVRPDSFFSDELPDLRLLPENMVTTWPKVDAPGSDQFFIVPRHLYVNWWKKKIRSGLATGLLSDGSVSNCCPEYEIFSGVQVNQDFNIKGCLARDQMRLHCWRNRSSMQPGMDKEMQFKYLWISKSTLNED
jgi:hypothetical protein